MAERGGDRALGARLDLEQLQRELLALLGERAGRRRHAFALGERLLERRRAARAPCVTRASRSSRSRSAARAAASASSAARPSSAGVGPDGHLARLDELELQLGEQALRRLVADAEALRGAAQRRAARRGRRRSAAPSVSARRASTSSSSAVSSVCAPRSIAATRAQRSSASTCRRARSPDGALRVGRSVARGGFELDRGGRVVRACSLELGADRGGERRAPTRAEAAMRSPPLRSR